GGGQIGVVGDAGGAPVAVANLLLAVVRRLRRERRPVGGVADAAEAGQASACLAFGVAARALGRGEALDAGAVAVTLGAAALVARRAHRLVRIHRLAGD